MPKLLLLFNLPLRVRGIKGVTSITPLSPLTLRGEILPSFPLMLRLRSGQVLRGEIRLPSYPSTSLRTGLGRGEILRPDKSGLGMTRGEMGGI
jgi:hypothetical protein